VTAICTGETTASEKRKDTKEMEIVVIVRNGGDIPRSR